MKRQLKDSLLTTNDEKKAVKVRLATAKDRQEQDS